MARNKVRLQDTHTIQALRQAIKESDDEKQKTRIRALIGIKEGKTVSFVAKTFVVTRMTIYTWIALYNERGIDALAMSKGGRSEGNPKWDTTIFTQLLEQVNTDNAQCWSIPRMQAWIQEKYALSIPETTILYHVTLQKFSYKSVRPHPYKGDREKQELFKKRDSKTR